MPGGPQHLPTDDPDWWHDAACRGLDPSIFYHPDDERGVLRRRREYNAKAICEPCPVRRACLDWALTLPELHGIWGGLTPQERASRRVHH
jgi:WhiB family transcriptional regulator, redox-sensing transcriptional regulator